MTSPYPYVKPCPTGTLVGQTAGAVVLVPAYCRRWACPDCGPIKARLLARRITACPARRFLTLTVRAQPAKDPRIVLDEMTAAWRALWKRIKRLQGEGAKGYVRIVELTKAGNPHLHLALDCRYIHQSVISRWWRELTGSAVVDIRTIRSDRGLARYLAKYLTKAHETLTSRRKWSQSRAFLPPVPPKKLEPDELPLAWSWRKGQLADVEAWYAAEDAYSAVYVEAHSRAPATPTEPRPQPRTLSSLAS